MEGGKTTHHGPYIVAHCLANSAAHEDYICDSEYKPTTDVIRQRASPKRAKEGTKRRGGGDQFLSGGVLSALLPRYGNIMKDDLLSRGEDRWAKVGTDSNKCTGDDTSVVAC